MHTQVPAENMCNLPACVKFPLSCNYLHTFYRNMIVDLECSKTQKTPTFKFDNEANKNQYVRIK